MPDLAPATTSTHTVHTVSVSDGPTRWPDLIAGILKGEEWLIVDIDGQTIATLAPNAQSPKPAAKRWKAFGMLKGQIEFAPDFDEPLEDLKPYME